MTSKRRRQTRTRRTTGFPPELHNAAVAAAHSHNAETQRAIAHLFDVPYSAITITRRIRRRLIIGRTRLDWMRRRYLQAVVAEATSRLAIAALIAAHPGVLNGWLDQAALAEEVDELTDRQLERERARDDDAAYAKCARCITTGPMDPTHTPSPLCPSGDPHCTCSYCF